MESAPRILLFDIETLPDSKKVLSHFTQLSNYPGLTFKASLSSIICFGYQWYGEKETHILNAWDFKPWNKNINDDKDICLKIKEIIESADALVTHNGKSFDMKFIQSRLFINNLTPVTMTIPHIDTKTLAKRCLLMFNNRLNTLAENMNLEKKLENGGWDLWIKVLSKDKKAMDLMSRYCKQDVRVLYQVFKKLLPFAKNIPNYNLFGVHKKPLCPSCGSTRLISDGSRATKTKVMQRLRCKDCGSCCSVNKNKAVISF